MASRIVLTGYTGEVAVDAAIVVEVDALEEERERIDGAMEGAVGGAEDEAVALASAVTAVEETETMDADAPVN